MPQLIAPTTQLHDSWLASRDERGRGVHQDGAGLRAVDDVETPEDFSVWVQKLRQQSDTSIHAKEGRVHATYWWIVEDDTYLGAISRRHTLTTSCSTLADILAMEFDQPLAGGAWLRGLCERSFRMRARWR